MYKFVGESYTMTTGEKMTNFLLSFSFFSVIELPPRKGNPDSEHGNTTAAGVKKKKLGN